MARMYGHSVEHPSQATCSNDLIYIGPTHTAFFLYRIHYYYYYYYYYYYSNGRYHYSCLPRPTIDWILHTDGAGGENKMFTGVIGGYSTTTTTTTAIDIDIIANSTFTTTAATANTTTITTANTTTVDTAFEVIPCCRDTGERIDIFCL
ncbi:hypothetical protein P167DRAFT_541519 [Morchella conica CCBAS932]|uniref:Uncharacterized protein n=1 Tax=Morchella conica CCBAS932 TaxID=1392247 RepID=A0A3N4L4N8_9PEZI|nr:hypothetical protein P167DRAFT_541519 [Morchella conica CCBAS932]